MRHPPKSGGGRTLKRQLIVNKVVPALIFFALWLDGWFYPLLLLPFPYVILIERKDLLWLGFRKPELRSSISFDLTTAIFLMAFYHPIFLHYTPLMKRKTPSPQDIFTDLVWYPLYEEIAYRSFVFAHFDFETSGLSKRNLLLNLLQAVLFLSVHRHHIISGIPLVLIGVLALAILNGLVFLSTRNILGCILSHSAIKGFALLLSWVYI